MHGLIVLVLNLLTATHSQIAIGNPSAVIWKDQLFTLTGAPDTFSPVWLYRAPFNPKKAGVPTPIVYDNSPALEFPGQRAKLHMNENRVLSYSGRNDYLIFPLSDLPLLENNLLGDKLRDPRLGVRKGSGHEFVEELETYSRYAAVILPNRGRVDNLVFPPHRVPDVPTTGTDRDEDNKPSGATYWETARHDLLLHGTRTVELIHAYGDQLFISVEPDCLNNWYRNDKGEIKSDLPPAPARHLRTGRLPAGFKEHFTAYRSGDDYYLVTESGCAFVASQAGKSKLKVASIWDDSKRPIVGVVQDYVSGAVYAWGYSTDRASPERFMMKMQPNPVPIPYRLSVNPWIDRSDAFLESYECARVFRTRPAPK